MSKHGEALAALAADYQLDVETVKSALATAAGKAATRRLAHLCLATGYTPGYDDIGVYVNGEEWPGATCKVNTEKDCYDLTFRATPPRTMTLDTGAEVRVYVDGALVYVTTLEHSPGPGLATEVTASMLRVYI